MTSTTLTDLLKATGFYPDGKPVVGLRLGDEAQNARARGRDFSPDALWQSPLL